MQITLLFVRDYFVNVIPDSSVVIKKRNDTKLTTLFTSKLSSYTWTYKLPKLVITIFLYTKHTVIEYLYKIKLNISLLFHDLPETEEYPWKFIKQHDSQGIAISRKKYNKNYDTTQLRSKTEERSVWIWQQHCHEYLLNTDIWIET